MFKVTIFSLCCLLVAVSGHYWGGDGHKDYHTYPKYKYEYGVKDHHTGDHKSQWEHRDGDVVKGGYTLDEADGTKRVVEYHSDKHSGLHAHVKRIGHAHHPQVYGHHHDHHGYGHGSGYSYSHLDQHH
ncbi:adult-specific cuticular protein ACP-20-like [Toxorhynchites rutilus septentrionalis]|uniref:adult-specific cuticular protein ACP-20-like n=1 Tax=Toxorhynchites rutilus septentrionalis TaxID=329112 RepID=UPI0024783F63|nr:adult-specific cuticular protein ACP-20-like [Toxorhynchites rutilus septentrionalis]